MFLCKETFPCVTDDGDRLYMHAASSILRSLHSLLSLTTEFSMI